MTLACHSDFCQTVRKNVGQARVRTDNPCFDSPRRYQLSYWGLANLLWCTSNKRMNVKIRRNPDCFDFQMCLTKLLPKLEVVFKCLIWALVDWLVVTEAVNSAFVSLNPTRPTIFSTFFKSQCKKIGKTAMWSWVQVCENQETHG